VARTPRCGNAPPAIVMHSGPMANTSSRADATAEADLLDTSAFEEADDAPRPRLLRPTHPSRDPDAAMPAPRHAR
jgi:hypothetical protein